MVSFASPKMNCGGLNLWSLANRPNQLLLAHSLWLKEDHANPQLSKLLWSSKVDWIQFSLLKVCSSVNTNNYLYSLSEFINRLETIITCFAGHAKAITATCAARLSGAALSIMDQRAANNTLRDDFVGIVKSNKFNRWFHIGEAGITNLYST